MGSIIKFNSKPPLKFGFKKVKQRKKVDLEKHGQMNLFSPFRLGKVIHLKSSYTPFEEALALDETGSAKVKDAYRAAIEAGDSTADAYCNLGILEFQDGNAVKAIDCFTLSLKIDPRHFESHYNLANLYSDLGNLSLSKVHYQMASEIQPDFPNVYFNLGLVYAITNDFDGAVSALLKYKELVPASESGNADDLLEALKKTMSRR